MRTISSCLFVLVTVAMIASVADIALADNTKSYEYDWYGYIKLDGAYDQNLTSHGNFVMWVNPEGVKDDEQFNMTANETRFGLMVKSLGNPEIKVAGQVEFDLYAGVTGGKVAENKAMLQLRHAYFSIEKKNFGVLAGQSWDLISPLNPATLNYPVLWGAGNIGYRRPQIRMWNNFGQGKTKAQLAAGFFRTIGSDLTPTLTLATGETSEGSDDGTDAGIPSFQGLFDVNHEFASGAKVRFGASGLWGRLKAETNLGNSEKYESWAACGHFMVSTRSGFGFSTEVFTGANLNSYFGGIVNNDRVDGLESKGGWAAVWMQASKQVKLTAGAGLDDPDDAELSDTNRSKNQSIFANIRYAVVPAATIGLEVSQWSTDYRNADQAQTMRVQTSFIFNF